jgi:transposase
MDNCSIHIDTRVGSLIADAGAVLLYSALYSPDLIPIEYMFHSWKAFLKWHSTEFFSNLLAIMSVTPEQGLNFG